VELRWVPVALNRVMALSGTPGSSFKMAWISIAVGVARVMSLKIMATLAPGGTMTANGLDPMGWRSATWSAACGSDNPGLNTGWMTVTSQPSSRVTGRPVSP
jgi:hypothetical protein